jgi:hypothetical protein
MVKNGVPPLEHLQNKKILLIALLDYIWVITIYVTFAFCYMLIVDAYILPPLNMEKELKTPTYLLAIEVLMHLALQGFVAIIINLFLQTIPSPFNGVFGYNDNNTLAVILRNPAIVSVIIFALSRTLQARLFILYSRYNTNALGQLKSYYNI